MKRYYPLFMIDRSKPKSYPFDFISCFDTECGFVARVIPFTTDIAYDMFYKECQPSFDFMYIKSKFKKGGVILLIEGFLIPNFDLFNEKYHPRIKTLLKKALKKYLHAEVERTAHSDLSIENQIKQQKLTIERAKSNYDALVSRSSKQEADYNIALAEATLQTLVNFRDNQKYFIINSN